MLNLDTHILIHALNGKLHTKEKQLLSEHQWGISAIVLWELSKLLELKRVVFDVTEQTLAQILEKLHTWPISWEICRQIKKLDFKSDPADEIIAATSIIHKVPLLTRDTVIKKSKLVPLA